MEQTTLKRLRTIIPGLLFIVVYYHLFSYYFEISISEIIRIENAILLVGCMGIGMVYNISGLRDIIIKLTLHDIDENIKNTLLKIYGKHLNDDQIKYLKDDKRLKGIFYQLVDNDKSLTAKSKVIYNNGLSWTTTADLIVICLIAGFTNIIFGASILNELSLIKSGYILIAIGFISMHLHKLTVKKHISLSDEQLEIIKMSYKDNLIERIDVVLHQMS